MRKTAFVIGLFLSQVAFSQTPAEPSQTEQLKLIYNLVFSPLSSDDVKARALGYFGGGAHSGFCDANNCGYTIFECVTNADSTKSCKLDAVHEIRERGLVDHEVVDFTVNAQDEVLSAKYSESRDNL
jgi:hypothetical protein